MKLSQFFALIAVIYIAPHINVYAAGASFVVFAVLAVLMERHGK